MGDIYLINYSVKGIKTLDQLVSLSFYKKTFTKEQDFQEYNIKGIYGINGSGKSGIVTSVEILKNILTNYSYLNNPIIQKNLDSIINKKTEELFIEVDYLIEKMILYRYSVTISKDSTGKYVISHEKLSSKKVTSKNDDMKTIFDVNDGKIKYLLDEDNDEFKKDILDKTMNLLSTASISALFFKNEFFGKKYYDNIIWTSIFFLLNFGLNLFVYIEQSDNHREYVTRNLYGSYILEEKYNINALLSKAAHFQINVDDVMGNIVPKTNYEQFEKTISKLYEFIHIFKSDLQGIEIEKKENRAHWICDLVMVYESYKIYAEYESTGIKKLIKLFEYLYEMVHGGIVFIDELDSNLHDVYLCALLEYLMEYGKGQLCFTTHNVGPMDVLKQRKKSIDFLSEDHKIYPWTKSGNYSPSKLYRNGMIEGSPFNVDSIDFISVFGSGEEDE
jgi:hypothetical protein